MGWRDTVQTVAAEVKQRRSTSIMLAKRNPGFREAVTADLQVTLKYRGERAALRDPLDAAIQTVRLAVVSDAFLAQLSYRGRVAMRKRGIPVLPAVAHRLSMVIADVCIGDPVIFREGVYIPHGQIVVDGISEVGSDTILFPWTTIGLRAGVLQGPKVGDGVHVGTGARVLGPLTLGERAYVGANAVVIHDVEADAVVVGLPARPTVKRGTEVQQGRT